MEMHAFSLLNDAEIVGVAPEGTPSDEENAAGRFVEPLSVTTVDADVMLTEIVNCEALSPLIPKAFAEDDVGAKVAERTPPSGPWARFPAVITNCCDVVAPSVVSDAEVNVAVPVTEIVKLPPDGVMMNPFVFFSKELDNFLHKHPAVAEAMKKRIEQSERERKELAGIKKLANERAKKANLHNRKLRDCRIHLNEEPPAKAKEDFISKQLQSTIFITEGDSASGSITKSRDVETQAVFSLRGKPLNCYGLTKKVVYENEEFNLLQHALNIEEGLDDLRYNNIIIATDADVDGMHIRLLLMTFFLQFFPDLVRDGHVYILETPLFRVRNKQETIYCYSDIERQEAIKKIGAKAEITRFKGLGEISPDEFKKFIGADMKKTPVILESQIHIQQLLEYFMGKNTQERHDFIVSNLRIELDTVQDSI
jgi:topoisomerase-4 subunit B